MSNLQDTFSPTSKKEAHPVVLVVEDHADTREMLQLLLEIYGCQVVAAEDGQEALSLAEQVHPDLILMDMKLPVLDGLTVTRRIRANATLNQVPIVAVTGLATPKDQAAARDAGCTYYLEKPVDLDRLEEVVSSLTHCAPGMRYSLAARSRGTLTSHHVH
jgi:two-component system, cell cycle response regulator DivK